MATAPKRPAMTPKPRPLPPVTPKKPKPSPGVGGQLRIPKNQRGRY